MSDFVLEISGAGEAITLEPIGCVDRQGAQTLIEAVESVQAARHDPAAGDPHGPHHGLHRRTPPSCWPATTCPSSPSPAEPPGRAPAAAARRLSPSAAGSTRAR